MAREAESLVAAAAGDGGGNEYLYSQQEQNALGGMHQDSSQHTQEAQYVRIPGKMWFVLPLSSGRDRWRCKSVRVCVTGVLMWSYVQHVPCSPDQ